MAKLENKVAFITGAGSGIGAATPSAWPLKGRQSCAPTSTKNPQGTAATIAEHGGKSAAMKIDVSSSDEVKAALEQTARDLGGLHIIYNNAGVGGGFGWDRTIAINLSGVYYGLFHGAPFLAERGGGAIISTASVAGLVGLVGVQPAEPGQPLVDGAGAYVAAKHGVAGLTKQFAITFARQGVRVNAIAPGYIETPMIAMASEDANARRFLESLHPMGRLGQAEEIAAAAAFLASDDASFITGIVLPVDGGYTSR